MSTRSGRLRAPVKEASPPRVRKGVSPPRTPSRVRKSTPPAQSPPRRKSPSRKSPSRKPVSKFPARKSPSRTTKQTIENAAQRSPSKRAVKSEVSLNVNEVSTTKPEIYRATRSRRSEYSIRDLTGENATETEDKLNGIDPLIHSNDIYGLRNRKSVEEIIPRRSSKLREYGDIIPDIRRSISKSVSKSISKSISQSIDTYSDVEDSETEILFKKSESVSRKLATPLRESISSKFNIGSRWEFGGRIGSASLILLIPATVFTILISCHKSCSFESLSNLTAFKSLSLWFGLQPLIAISSQYIIQAVFTVLQIFGTPKERLDDLGTIHSFNAFLSSFITVNILYSLKYFEIFDDNLLVTDYVRLAVVSYLFSVTLSMILYVKSRKMNDSDLNPYGNTGYVLYDFCMGREIHPFIKGLDVKLWIYRISNISTLVLLIILFKHGFIRPQKEDLSISWESANLVLSKVKPTVLLFTMMQMVYILNFIIKENKVTSTFFWQSEGLGYLQLVSSALYPFLFTTVSKFVVDSDLKLSNNVLIGASILYLIGLLIMMMSNKIKHEFRRNPLQSAFSNLETMPTFHGKKLLVSGPWGVVRHPNYIGDILIHIALALPGILTGTYLAAAPALITILVLLHRAWRDHARCKRRYGAAWERYSKKVPKIFIPKLV